jgi:hypothetical protein
MRSGASPLSGTPSTHSAHIEALRQQIAALELDHELALTEPAARA